MKAIIKLIVFSLLFSVFSCSKPSFESVHKAILNKNWSFKEVSSKKWLTATIPGCVHTDLMNNKIIENPFYRLNESKVQWVDKKDWIYRTNFQLTQEVFQKEHHELCFEGLDTYAQVFLNDSLILKSNNMHRTYRVKVKKHLLRKDNVLEVILDSPIKKGLELYNAMAYTIPVSANDQAETGEVEQGKRVSVFSRKAAYHYGWDWGPRLVTSGIWRPISLISWDNIRINDLRVKYTINDDYSAEVKANVIVESSSIIKSVDLYLKINDSTIIAKKINLKKGLQELLIPFTLKNIKLWWPNTLGDQILYNLEVSLQYENNIDTKQHKLGFRTIEFVPDTNFQFIVNNHPTFIKGVNYIPQDIFLSRVKKEDYLKTLLAVKNANMNMVRVWGGGIYEDNYFYELCDSLGLLVWQDFMFACAMYPGDDEFLENVRLEAEDNFKRLSKYTSIALWCGNNEVLSAWKRWGWEKTAIEEQSPAIADKIWKHYDTIFHYILPNVVNKYSSLNYNKPAIGYWSSSPSASQGVAESYLSGDTHYWGVWWGKEPFENFNTKISSFMSEYGFQSFPEYSTFKKFAVNEDKGMYSKVMKHHQRSSIGNSTIEEYISREYKKPKDFESLLHTSQILQADGIQTAVEAHRRNKDRCKGTLYWQLNDCWPGVSWSSIDYYGTWKALHYKVKEAFKPIIISHEFVDSNIHIYLVSDLLQSIDCKVEVLLRQFANDEITNKWSKNLTVNKNSAIVALVINKSDLPNGIDKKHFYLELKLKLNDELISSKNILFLPFKNLVIKNSKIAFEANYQEKEKKIVLKIKSNTYAKGVHFTSKSVSNFSDNYFDLQPLEEKTIELSIKEDEPSQAIINSIKYRTLWENFN